MAMTEGIPLSSGEGLGVRPMALMFSVLTFEIITQKIVTPPLRTRVRLHSPLKKKGRTFAQPSFFLLFKK
jgi:hypothetical protein